MKDSIDKSPQALSSVVIWVRTPGPAPKISRSGDKVAKKTQVEPFEEPPTVVPDSVNQVEVEAYKKFHKSASEQVSKFIKLSGGVVKYQSDNAPLLFAVVPNSLVAAIEQRNDVYSIELDHISHPTWLSAAQAIDAPKVWQRIDSNGVAITGNGVKIAVIEQQGIYFAHNNLADGSYCNSITDLPTGPHATAVAGAIASTNAIHKGVAHGAPALLSGNVIGLNTSETIKCTDWAINNGAKVINWSFGGDSAGYLLDSSHYADYVVRNHHVTLTAGVSRE